MSSPTDKKEEAQLNVNPNDNINNEDNQEESKNRDQ